MSQNHIGILCLLDFLFFNFFFPLIVYIQLVTIWGKYKKEKSNAGSDIKSIMGEQNKDYPHTQKNM